MAAIVKIIGWLATAAGVIFIILPFVSATGLSADTIVSVCAFLLVAGPLLIAVSHVIEVAEKIQANTSWFSTGGMPPGQARSDDDEAPAPSEPEPAPNPTPAPAPEQEAPPAPAERPLEPALPRSERQPARRPPPQLYDANVHPAAVDEWTHNSRRVMTLEDGTFATELDGAWYRFLKLDDIDALRS
ncbi:MAG: hypothetical protein HKN11_17745 [Rhizobiales bacterium]|nr:hypothetical protein [Hyphomicrobiales bacterium]